MTRTEILEQAIKEVRRANNSLVAAAEGIKALAELLLKLVENKD